ncbi:MAG TPA: hypothetical protein VEB22_08900 [Phycisphaerales bacterium]|nr:hypothetical protein [Phycisphaerales bacterium]
MSVAVGWLVRLRSRSGRLSRLALRRLARLQAPVASAGCEASADMPRDLTFDHSEKYFAQI